jgi:hypothetical protein
MERLRAIAAGLIAAQPPPEMCPALRPAVASAASSLRGGATAPTQLLTEAELASFKANGFVVAKSLLGRAAVDAVLEIAWANTPPEVHTRSRAPQPARGVSFYCV